MKHSHYESFPFYPFSLWDIFILVDNVKNKIWPETAMRLSHNPPMMDKRGTQHHCDICDNVGYHYQMVTSIFKRFIMTSSHFQLSCLYSQMVHYHSGTCCNDINYYGMFHNGEAQNALPPSGEGRDRERVSRPAHSESSAGRECPAWWPASRVTHSGRTPKSDSRNCRRCPPSRNAAALRHQPAEWRTAAKKPWDGPALTAHRCACTPEGFPRLGPTFWNVS